MKLQTLEKKLKPLEAPIENELLRWLYLHLPPQPIKSRKMHNSYSEATRIVIRESDGLDAENRAAVGQYLRAVIPFIEQYEKREFPIGPAAAGSRPNRHILSCCSESPDSDQRCLNGLTMTSEPKRWPAFRSSE
jgi:hypothetical protein